jgi:hypothetical protein
MKPKASNPHINSNGTVEVKFPKRYFESVPRKLVNEMEASARLAAAACFASADSKSLLARAGASMRPSRDGPANVHGGASGGGPANVHGGSSGGGPANVHGVGPSNKSADTSNDLGAGCAGRENCQKDDNVLQSKGQWDLIVCTHITLNLVQSRLYEG